MEMNLISVDQTLKIAMRKLLIQILYSLLLLWFSLSLANAQQVFKTTAASVIGYLEYVPQDYNSNSNKYPVVIFLHGIGERGVNSTDPSVISGTIQNVAKLGPPMFVKNGTQFPFILISPQLKNNYGTWPSSYVMEVINYVKTYLRIDERRIYLTGLSLGGGGVWVAAQDFPELFAAIAPVCGGYNSPSKACGIASANLPVWAFHGDKDTTVPMSKTVNMVNAINACTPTPNPLAKLTIYPGVGHSAWNNAYKTDNSIHNPNLYQWIQSYTNTTNLGNKIPIANAGEDKTIALPVSTILTGSGTDSDGTITSYSWTQISGPSVSTLTNKLTSALTISGLSIGTYVYSLQVKDNSGNTDTDYIKLTVTAANITPVANAGSDKTITLPVNSLSITGTATDADGTIASYVWSKVSGSTATLSGASTATLTASALTEGSYTFRLTVTDNNGATKSDDMKVTVLASVGTGVNQAPVANAGADKTITLPTNAINLTGSATDSDGTIAYHKWYKVSGPYCYYYGVSSYTLQLSSMAVGTHKFKLVVRDNLGLETIDEVTIIVKDVVTSATSFAFPMEEQISEATSSLFASAEPSGLGERTLSQLENSTVVVFNETGERIYAGSWKADSYGEVMNNKGLYIYNIIREGKRMESGKIYIRN
jgi:dienelactone hydrolase